VAALAVFGMPGRPDAQSVRNLFAKGTKMKRLLFSSAFVAVLIAMLSMPSFAQKYELYPYAGGSFIGDFNAFTDQVRSSTFFNPGLFGIKGGVWTSHQFQIEGNFGYMNQFRIENNAVKPSIHAFQYEALATYNFSQLGKIFPYVTAGAGGLTLSVNNNEDPQNPNQVTYGVLVTPYSSGGPIPNFTRTFTVNNNDTFFTFSYGGGIKLQRLIGPVGLRFELHGRTIPNYYGGSLNSWEPLGGILVSWGER
jgi:opacity protein-like surface antigen